MCSIGWNKTKKADIVCIQETHCESNIEQLWEREWGFTCIFSNYNSRSAGVAILLRNTFEYTLHGSKLDNSGRVIVSDITINQNRLTLACIYGHNQDKPEFYKNGLSMLQVFNNTTMILCGYWNTVQDRDLDTHNILHHNNPNSQEAVKNIVNTYDLLILGGRAG